MRHFTRLMVALLTFATGLTATTVWSALQPSEPAARHDSINVSVSSVEFYEWHWQQFYESSLKRELVTPSYLYHQIGTWQAEGYAQPEQIDVICHLENHGSRSVDLMIMATGDFIVSPVGQAATESERRQRPLLTERQNIGQRVIHDLAPGEVREVKFTNFDLKALVDKYLHKEYGTLRPFELRVSVDVRTLDNLQVAAQQGQLRLTPGRKIAGQTLPDAELTMPDDSVTAR